MATPVGADLSQSFKDGMIEADESSNFIPVDKKDRYGSLVMKPAAMEESIPEAVTVHTGVDKRIKSRHTHLAPVANAVKTPGMFDVSTSTKREN